MKGKLFSVDKTLNKIFQEAEEKFSGRVSRDQIRDIFFMFWYIARESIGKVSLPSILIPKFGRILPMSHRLKGTIKYHKENDEEELANEYFASYQRIKQETEKRKNGRNKKK